jgi:hypothetical protein
MSGVISTHFGLMVPHGHLDRCIVFLEDGLRCLTSTPYHQVLGKSFLNQAEDLTEWIADFSMKADAASVGLAALYLEMNGFTINPDEWHCHLFGYKTAGDVWDLDWLSSWDAENRGCFVLRGMEEVQQAFADLHGPEDQPLGVRLAEEVTEHLVTARFMQLVATAHERAKKKFSGLDGMPVLATAHDWDTVHQTV